MVSVILTEELPTDFNGVFGSNYLPCPCFSSRFSLSRTPIFEISLSKKRVKQKSLNSSLHLVNIRKLWSLQQNKQRDSVGKKKSEEKGKFGKLEKEKCAGSSDFSSDLLEVNKKYEGVGVVNGGGKRMELGMVKNQKRQSVVSKERHVDEMVSMEREAFKTMDGDAYDKPRVTKAEMEERIQKLAKW